MGDVIGVARIAAIMASKRTADLVPLCHPIALTHVDVAFELHEAASEIRCTATCECKGQTGVEMEALTAVQVGLLTNLRHVQGSRSRDGDERDLPARKGGRQVRTLDARLIGCKRRKRKKAERFRRDARLGFLFRLASGKHVLIGAGCPIQAASYTASPRECTWSLR